MAGDSDERSKALRLRLASVGIVLDEPSSARTPPKNPNPEFELDRREIRAVLIAAGAPARDLEWLVASCPSLESARGYRPPPER